MTINFGLAAEDLEDFLTEAIDDSLDMDWSPRDAAKQIIRTLQRDRISTIDVPSPPSEPK